MLKIILHLRSNWNASSVAESNHSDGSICKKIIAVWNIYRIQLESEEPVNLVNKHEATRNLYVRWLKPREKEPGSDTERHSIIEWSVEFRATERNVGSFRSSD